MTYWSGKRHCSNTCIQMAGISQPLPISMEIQPIFTKVTSNPLYIQFWKVSSQTILTNLVFCAVGSLPAQTGPGSPKRVRPQMSLPTAWKGYRGQGHFLIVIKRLWGASSKKLWGRGIPLHTHETLMLLQTQIMFLTFLI